MATAESLKDEIRAELEGHGVESPESLTAMILEGSARQALDELFFFTPPTSFPRTLETLEGSIQTAFPSAAAGAQRAILAFLVELTTRLGSFMPRWNLIDASRHGTGALDTEAIEGWRVRAQALTEDLSHASPEAAAGLLGELTAETASRLKVEAVPEPGATAAAWAGTSLGSYLRSYLRAIGRSNLRQIAELRAVGRTRTEISNDYAAYLPYALHLGASFVTCNPPLVDLAWQADPPRWNAVIDAILESNPSADGEELARKMTLEVVLNNMRQLRPIFLLTSGEMGSVSLQVNPKKHDDAGSMIQDARTIYAELRERLNGGVPNVVFKLPGTNAGLEACRTLTADAIGVNITVNFGLFQHLPFAEAIRGGHAVFSVLSHMSGRLAFPVRDELLGKLDQLSRAGIDEAHVRQAAAWSGVMVLKRLHRLLLARGYDLSKVRPLIASMRIYEGEAYRDLPSPIPDITEVVGTSILTVFPNVRRAFDDLPAVTLEPDRIEQSVPSGVIEVLAHSQIFRQAYYLDLPGWGKDAADLKPDYALRLNDEIATAAWLPVHNTLAEFCKAYDVFVERIQGRRRLAELRHRVQSSTGLTPGDGASLTQALLHFDLPTVRDVLGLLSSIPPSPLVGTVLRAPEVGRAMQARKDKLCEDVLAQALARHATQEHR